MIISGDNVELDDFEMRMCSYVGRARFENSEARMRDHGLGPSKFERVPDRDIIGAQCEFAASIMLNCYWRPHVGIIDQPDVGGCVEVRSTVLERGRLIVKPDDNEWPFVLILQEGSLHTFLGWAMASDVKREPLLTFPGNDPAHFMEQGKLGERSELLRYLRDYR